MSIHNTSSYTRSDVLLFMLPFLALLLLFLAIWGAGNNRDLFLTLNHAAQIVPSGIWAFISFLGDGVVAIALLGVVVLRSPVFATTSLGGGLLVSLIIRVLKKSINVERPAAVFAGQDFTIIGDTLKQLSFPSGHSATALFIASCFIFFFRQHMAIRIMILAACLLVAFSRIAVGAHWPLDVLAGSSIGWICGYLLMVRKRNWSGRRNLQRLSQMIILLAILIIPFVNSHLPVHQTTTYLFSGFLLLLVGYQTWMLYGKKVT